MDNALHPRAKTNPTLKYPRVKSHQPIGTADKFRSASGVATKVKVDDVPKTPTLRAGVVAVVGIFGLAWLGDSFIADVQDFAKAVVYATDNGAQVIAEALGTLNHTSYGQSAVDYAYANGVLLVASQADEAAGHHNWPAAYDRTMLVNAIRNRSLPTTHPDSYLYLGSGNFHPLGLALNTDKPIVCAALAQWNSGRTRLALGGYGSRPMLGMDGSESDAVDVAARNAFHEATDEWGSAEYRMDVAPTLAKRCLEVQ